MREITVYNTMTRQKEVFNPVTPGEAKMYVCGVTPYNHPHIGIVNSLVQVQDMVLVFFELN